MPTVYKCVLRYVDENSGMSWMVTNYRYEDLPSDVFLAMNNWNEAYMNCCSSQVKVVDGRVYSMASKYTCTVFAPEAFIATEGAIAQDPTEISSYAQCRMTGSLVNKGSSAWKLHGFGQTLIEGSKLTPGSPPVTALLAASLTYFRQYRPNASIHLPAVLVPAAFEGVAITGMYVRRTGRTFLSPGQQRRYTRTAAAS